MATKNKIVIDEDKLLCSICLEIYTNPRILPCAHSFCDLCLRNHIKESVRLSQTKTAFNCPVCRAVTPAPGRDVPSVKWADEFPENFTLASILDSPTVRGSSIAPGTPLCDLCKRNELTVAATSYCVDCGETLCAECKRYHSKSKTSFTHVLKPIDDSMKDKQVLAFVRKLEYCQIHCDKKIEYLCKDHGDLCCADCVIQNHRPCNLESVEKKAKTCASTAKTMKIQMERIESRADRVMVIEQKQSHLMHSVKRNARLRLENLKRKIDETYEKLSDMTLQNVQKECANISSKSVNNKIALRGLRCRITDSRKKLDDAVTHGNDTQVYVLTTQLEQEVQQYSSEIQKIEALVQPEDIVVDEKTDLTEMMNWVSIQRTSSMANLFLTHLDTFRLRLLREERAMLIIKPGTKQDQ